MQIKALLSPRFLVVWFVLAVLIVAGIQFNVLSKAHAAAPAPGCLEGATSPTSVANGTLTSITATGYAYDPANPNAAVNVQITDGGSVVATVPANGADGIDSGHGFSATFSVTALGSHGIDAFRVNANGTTTQLNCGTHTVDYTQSTGN